MALENRKGLLTYGHRKMKSVFKSARNRLDQTLSNWGVTML